METDEPPIPDGVELGTLGRDVRQQLRTLPRELADRVGAHLAAAELLADTDPELAYEHAQAAVRRGSRLAVVREAAGVAAYGAGRWADAMRELRAARRMAGSDELLPLIADCERGLGRPERALTLATSTDAARLEGQAAVEMLIVAAGARRDMGQLDAAVVMLQVPELRARTKASWQLRLRYTYADLLAAVGRDEEALSWFERVAAADHDGETDAPTRVAELRGEPAPEPRHRTEADDEDAGIIDLANGDD